tara:strand:+ start:749 stop:961 length:213 start_codon:yes stop_codon:yes gene_type:complete
MIGKLVRITRASIGVPKGTLGLVLKAKKTAWKLEDEAGPLPTWMTYTVLLCQPEHRERRYLAEDLKVVEV